MANRHPKCSLMRVCQGSGEQLNDLSGPAHGPLLLLVPGPVTQALHQSLGLLHRRVLGGPAQPLDVQQQRREVVVRKLGRHKATHTSVTLPPVYNIP